jgi:hypothetical protein
MVMNGRSLKLQDFPLKFVQLEPARCASVDFRSEVGH